MARRIYWEASVFNAWLNREAERFDICDAILRAAERDELHIVTSALTLVEVYGYPLKGWQEGRISEEQMANAEARVEGLFKAPFIEVVDLDRFIAGRARDIRRQVKGLSGRTTDAIHLASALMTSVEEMHTYDDDDLLQLSPFQGLVIKHPSRDFQPRLPEFGA